MGLRKYIHILAVVLILGLLAAPVGASSAERLTVERQVYEYLTTELKLSTAAACGVLANIEHESNFNPTIYGDKGTSYGLCQWHNSRFTALRGYCSALGLDYRTVAGQMAYLKYELGNNYTSLLLTLQSIDNTPDGAYRAGYLWCVRFEMPSNMEVKGHNRGSLAKGKYWNRYQGGEPLVMLPVPEYQEPEIEDVMEELRQPSVAIPLPPTENTQTYEFPRPEFIYYSPWHLPQTAIPTTQPEAPVKWHFPALGILAALAVVVWFWPLRKKALAK